MRKLLVLAALAAILPASMHAQTASDGGISPEVLTRISKGYVSVITLYRAQRCEGCPRDLM